jgi:hypothetical protein
MDTKKILLTAERKSWRSGGGLSTEIFLKRVAFPL